MELGMKKNWPLLALLTSVSGKTCSGVQLQELFSTWSTPSTPTKYSLDWTNDFLSPFICFLAPQHTNNYPLVN
jgi:hypothetical protein